MFDDEPHVRARLEEAVVIWLTTVTPDGQPQSSPVWFIVDGDELLVFSRANVPRVRNIGANGHVAVNLDTLDDGEEVLTMEADARIDASAHPANEVSAYLDKYAARIAGNDWTPEVFARDYPICLRIRPTRVRASGRTAT
jgi:PPOX class probable F420-dependent enzyme